MAIQYRSVNAEEVETQVKAARAQEAEATAFSNEMEIVRLQAVLATVTTKEDKDALANAIKAAEASAKSARNKATRLNSDGALNSAGITAARRTFLESWITSLEQEHVAHSTVIAQREAALASTGTSAPSAAEKAEISLRLDDSKAAVKVIESSWNVATKEYDSIAPAPAVDPAPAPTPVQPAPTPPTPTPRTAR